MVRRVRDSDGNEIRDGDTIYFSFGIPPVRVEARVAMRNGVLVAITAPHHPPEVRLDRLMKYVGAFYKIPQRTPPRR